MMGFLARRGRRLIWRDGARLPDQLGSGTSAGGMVCRVGLAHRQLRGVESIGVDEIHWGRGLKADNFLTVICQIDAGCRRLVGVGRRSSQAMLRRSLKAVGRGRRRRRTDRRQLRPVRGRGGKEAHGTRHRHDSEPVNAGLRSGARHGVQGDGIAAAGYPRRSGSGCGVARGFERPRQGMGHLSTRR